MSSGFRALYAALPVGAGEGFAARSVPGSDLHFIGRDREGRPAVLLGSTDSPHTVNPPVRLNALDVSFAAMCRIRLADGSEHERRFTLLRCISTDDVVHSYFLELCAVVVRLVGASPRAAANVLAVRRLVDIFQRLSRPASREVLGLYAELLLIKWSPDARTAIGAWRSAAESRFDFALEDLRVDVKASGTRTRVHHFSLDQCRPPPGTVGVIASILLEPGSGMSLAELIRAVEERLNGNAAMQMKLHDIVAETLGAATAEGMRVRYDERAARASLALFFLERIPRPDGTIPPSVSDVRFRVDLSGLAPDPRPTICAASAVATAILL
jgi:hypothetical protein